MPPPPQPTPQIQHIKSTTLTPSGAQTPGMTRSAAISNSGTSLSASSMTAEPRSSSAVHHHGPQDTIIFAVRGRGGCIYFRGEAEVGTTTEENEKGGKEMRKMVLEPGDYALIPAWTEHQEVNEGDEEVVWSVVRSGSVPEVVNLSGWGGEPV